MNKIYLSEVILLTKSYNLQDFKDWLHWHLDVVRFDHVHIFDNESPVDIKTVCESYGEKVSYELVKGWPNQYALYNRYINNESKAWWVLPIDDDEYLWMKNFTDVNDMLLDYYEKWPDMLKLSIRWKNMFPENPLASREKISLMDFCKNSNERWASYMPAGNKPVKTFLKTTRRWTHTIKDGHNPNLSIQSYLCNGNKIKGNLYNGPDTDNDLKLLHFQYKSKDEWINKCRTRFDAVNKKNGLYNSKNENIIEKLK